MICIVGTRCSGKTRKLLEMSHDTGLPIAVKTEQQAVNLARAARALGLGIPDVLIIRPGMREFGSFHSLAYEPTKNGPMPVLIDDLESFFADVGIRAEAVTIDARAVNIEDWLGCNPSLRDCLHFWWNCRRKVE